MTDQLVMTARPGSKLANTAGPDSDLANTDELLAWPASFFQGELRDKLLPNVPLTVEDPFYPLIRGWVVDLGSEFDQLSANTRVGGTLRVYADTLVIPRDWHGKLNGVSLIIVARQVETDGGAHLRFDLSKSPDAQLVVCAGTMVGEIPVEVAGRARSSSDAQSGPLVFHLAGEAFKAGIGCRLWQPDVEQEPCLEPLDRLLPDLAARARPLSRLLLGQYQGATILLSRGRIAQAIGIADWVRRCAASNAELTTLALDAAELATLARAIKTEVPHVPRLSFNRYRQLAESYVEALAAYEEKRALVALSGTVKAGFAEAAEAMLKEAERTIEYDERLLAQTLKAFRRSQRNVDEMERRVRDRVLTIQLLQFDLKAEAEKHLIDEIVSAGFEFCTACVSSIIAIGAAIGGAVATGGATAPTVVTTAGAVLVNAGEIVVKGGIKISVEMKEVEQAGLFSEKTTAGLKGAATALVETGKLASKIYKIIKTVVDQAERANKICETLQEGKFGDIADDELTGSSYWELMAIAGRSSLKLPLAMDLPSAQRLLDEIESLAVEGRALAAQRSATLQLGQELTRLVWRQQMSADGLNDLRTRVGALREDVDDVPDEIGDWVEIETASIKRGLFAELYNCMGAYRYYALKGSSITPSVIEDAATYRDMLRTLDKEIAQAEEARFDPAPQPFENHEVLVTDPECLDALKRGEPAVVPVRLDAEAFRHLDRVRVDCVRAWLDGAKSNGEALLVEIRAGGTFADRFAGEPFLFTGGPCKVAFRYRPGKGEEGILMDGIAARRQAGVYFLPTPFADWTVTPMLDDETDIDMSGLSGLRLSFGGSAIDERVR